MFNKYVFVNDNKSAKEAAIIAAKASREHDKALKDISEAEIKSKDRVDITLAEYEALKMENAALRERCMQYEAVFRRIHIDPKVLERINPDTVFRWEIDDHRTFAKHIRIEFDVNCFL